MALSLLRGLESDKSSNQTKEELNEIFPHVLLCYDGTPSSERAFSYIKEVFQGVKLGTTLLKIVEHPDGTVYHERSILKRFEKEEEIERRTKEVFESSRELLANKAKVLREALRGPVRYEVLFRLGHLADDILRFARENLYDAVVVGKRGLSKITTFIMGGVTHKLVEKCCVPVWVIRGESWNKKFLVAFDLGEMGLRVLDYVSFLFAFHKEAQLIFLHIAYPFSSVKEFEGTLVEVFPQLKDPEYVDFFSKIKNIFHKNEFPEERARFILKRGIFGPTGEIVKLAKKEDCSTVIVGKRGRGALTKLFLGSVSHKVMSYFEDRAVWIVI